MAQPRATSLITLSLAMLCGLAARAEQPFRLASPDLPKGKTFTELLIASDWGCTGGNQSPALTWSGQPTGTKSFAVTLYDRYKPPVSGWWHWLVYDLPSTATAADIDALIESKALAKAALMRPFSR